MLKYRLMSAAVIFSALGGAFFAPDWVVLLVLLALGLVMFVEFYALLDRAHIRHFKIFGVVSGLLLIGVTWFSGGQGAADRDFLMAVAGVIFLRQMAEKDMLGSLHKLGGTLLGILYVALCFNYFVLILIDWPGLPGRLLVLYLVAVVKSSDVGAYAVGMTVGRHKLCPRISPGKTWEGFIGGLVFSAAVSAAWVLLSHGRVGPLTLTWPVAAGVGLLLGLSGTAGDLIESLMKRAAQVKDSGHFIKGMGGMLDVMDSLLLSAPVLYCLARYLLT